VLVLSGSLPSWKGIACACSSPNQLTRKHRRFRPAKAVHRSRRARNGNPERMHRSWPRRRRFDSPRGRFGPRSFPYQKGGLAGCFHREKNHRHGTCQNDPRRRRFRGLVPRWPALNLSARGWFTQEWIGVPNSPRYRLAPLVSTPHVQHFRTARFLSYGKSDLSPRFRRRQDSPPPWYRDTRRGGSFQAAGPPFRTARAGTRARAASESAAAFHAL
jgi:hypothetical protein